MEKLLIVITAVVVEVALPWIITVGLIKLITLCFGWGFSWATATGVWLVLMLARWVISAAKSHDN